MNLISIKRIQEVLSVTNDVACKVRLALERERAGRRISPERTLRHIDVLIEGFGIEYVNFKNGNVAFAYVNTGDSYNGTIVYNYKTLTFQATTVGDIVERDMTKYA
jgi:hypothetical protein